MKKKTLSLPANPRSVRVARSWVRARLEQIGREELVGSAELAVSELVTNAILHASPPVTVRVLGTKENPRIEVSDRSVVPPQPGPADEAYDASDMATTGRGLHLVAVHSARWGSEIEDDARGKTVWFEPAPEGHEGVDLAGELFDVAALLEELKPSGELVPVLPVRLLNLPVQLMAASRRSWADLRRELNLLTLSHPGQYPDAEGVLELFATFETERLAATGVDALDAAIAAGETSIDIDYLVPRQAPETFSRMRALAGRLYADLGDEVLLSALPSPAVRQLQDWYFAQFVDQAAGAAPVRWTGPMHDE